MIIDPNLALRAIIAVAELISKIHEDIPPAERVKVHERWGRVFDLLWKHVEQPTPPTP